MANRYRRRGRSGKNNWDMSQQVRLENKDIQTEVEEIDEVMGEVSDAETQMEKEKKDVVMRERGVQAGTQTEEGENEILRMKFEDLVQGEGKGKGKRGGG